MPGRPNTRQNSGGKACHLNPAAAFQGPNRPILIWPSPPSHPSALQLPSPPRTHPCQPGSDPWVPRSPPKPLCSPTAPRSPRHHAPSRNSWPCPTPRRLTSNGNTCFYSLTQELANRKARRRHESFPPCAVEGAGTPCEAGRPLRSNLRNENDEFLYFPE